MFHEYLVLILGLISVHFVLNHKRNLILIFIFKCVDKHKLIRLYNVYVSIANNNRITSKWGEYQLFLV
jgi:hypothetical protein